MEKLLSMSVIDIITGHIYFNKSLYFCIILSLLSVRYQYSMNSKQKKKIEIFAILIIPLLCILTNRDIFTGEGG